MEDLELQQPAAAAVIAELQAVLEQACSALQAQEEGRVNDAVQGYFLARSRVHYVAQTLLRPLAEGQQLPTDGQPPTAGPEGQHPTTAAQHPHTAADPDAALAAAACALLQETYTAAIERLTSGSNAVGAEQGRDGGGELAGASAASEDSEELFPAGGYGGGGGWDGGYGRGNGSGSLRGADAGLLEARPQGGGRMRSGGGGSKEQQGLVALGQRCLQEVAGSLDEVVGLADIKQELREAVLLPMRFPHLFTGIRRPQCNIVFHGVPGTGKTLLVKKLAAEAGVPLFCVCPSAILSKWAGESEKTLRGVFEAAATLSPAIIFIDEVDSLAPTRSSGDDLAARRVLTELLIQMTAAATRPDRPVYVLAATNRLQDCDPALLRRFDRKVEVPPPDAEARAAFFAATVARPEINARLSEEELCQLAAATQGCTGSDLAALCRDAAMAPVRELLAGCSGGAGGWQAAAGEAPGVGASLRPVCCQDFLTAFSRIAPAAGSVC